MGKYSSRLLGSDTEEGSGKYSSRLLGEGSGSPGAVAQPLPQPAKQEGWGEWIVNSVKGVQDPAYSGVGSIYDQFTDELRSPTASAAMAGASDPQMSDIVKATLGNKVRRIEKDSQGRDVFVTQGPDGNEQKGYLNTPGLDSTDIWRGVYGATPYIASAGIIGKATKGMNWLAQGIAQGLGAGGTSVAGDVAQIPMGSEQFVELPKAAINTGLGFISPPVAAAGSALWRRFVTVPGMVDKAGKLTPKGMEAATKAGLDPADLTPEMAKEFASSYAKSGDAALAAARSTAEPMGIPATTGQTTKRPFLLNQEEKLRRGLYGEKAEREMLQFDALQRQRIEEAALGGGERPGIGETIAPDRPMGRGEPVAMGSNVRDALQTARQSAKTAERDLWESEGVKKLAATPEALEMLPDRIGTALKDETDFTGTGEKMAKMIGEFVDGDLPVREAGGIQLKAVKTVDQMRRRLFTAMQSAEPGTDGRQSKMIYDAFNDWIGESAEKQLLSGDALAAAQLVKARGFTREVRQLFEPKSARGRTLPGGDRLQKALESADSGEGVLQALIGSPGSKVPQEGVATALRQTKQILDRFGGEGGKAAWNDVRLAYWTRLITGKNGEIVGAQALTNNIKSALKNNMTVLRTLYTPDELRQMRNFMRATETVAYKPPNASGSGYTVMEGLQELTGKLLNFLPGGKLIGQGLELTGVPNQVNVLKARAATSQSVPTVRPNIAPAIVGVGSSQSRD